MPIRLPICNFDAKTGILCGDCTSKLRNGVIGRADVEASKALVVLAERIAELGRATLRKSYESRGNYLLEFDASDLPVLRAAPSLRTELEGALGGRVWIVGAGGAARKFLEEVFFPARVLTVNTVWLPDGSKRTKVIVPGRRSERNFGEFDKLRDMVREARRIEILVETEREAMLQPGY